jgi:hypothetical protein
MFAEPRRAGRAVHAEGGMLAESGTFYELRIMNYGMMKNSEPRTWNSEIKLKTRNPEFGATARGGFCV